MQKYFFFTVVVLSGATAAAAPGPISQVFDDVPERELVQARPAGSLLNYSTGFEPEEGYVLGFINGQPGNCSSSTPCWSGSVNMSGSTVEGHIDTVNPSAGVQHLRLSHDPVVIQPPFGLTIAARFPRNEDVVPRPLAPIYFSFDVSAYSDLYIYVQSRAQGALTTAVWIYNFNDTDLILVLDDRTGIQEWHVEHFIPVGVYQRMRFEVNPCEDFVAIYLGNNLIYGSQLWNATDADQIVFGNMNTSASYDFDDFQVVSGEPCPVFGACCDTNGAGQGCTEGILDADCSGDDKVFHANLTCGEITCECSPNCVDRVCGPNGCGGFCGNCSNGDVCDGVESCNASGQCEPGVPLVCDDGLYCTGVETCYSNTGCQTGVVPCEIDEVCDEVTDSCVLPAPPAIPAAGEWGLVVLSILILIGSKLRFRRTVESFPS